MRHKPLNKWGHGYNIPLSILITEDQHRRLLEERGDTHTSVCEIVRQALDEHFEKEAEVTLP